MFPTLGHLLSYIFGTEVYLPLPTFGFMVVMAILSAILWTVYEFKRLEKLGVLKPRPIKQVVGQGPQWGDLIVWALFGFFIGFKLIPLIQRPEILEVGAGQFLFSSHGNLLYGIIGALLAGGYYYWRSSKEKLEKPKEVTVMRHPYEEVSDMAVWAVVAGIIGAKLFHNLEYWEDFITDPIGNLLSIGGFTFYGGLLFGALAVIYYIRKRGWPFWKVADAIAPSIALAYGVGRIGCQLAGDGDWGIVNKMPKPDWLSWLPDWMWAFTYPHNVINAGVEIPGCTGLYCRQLPEPVFPTPFYETIMALIIFGILVFISRKFSLKPGSILGLFLILMGIERWLIEKIRVNRVYESIGMTQAELISLGMIIGGVALLSYIFKSKTNESYKNYKRT